MTGHAADCLDNTTDIVDFDLLTVGIHFPGMADGDPVLKYQEE